MLSHTAKANEELHICFVSDQIHALGHAFMSLKQCYRAFAAALNQTNMDGTVEHLLLF